ncbi:hypothetical protein BH09BAC2_BH09BAC2_06550 [soil metagenome]
MLPEKTFKADDYSFYDTSHFYKSVRQFFENHKAANLSINNKDINVLQNQS